MEGEYTPTIIQLILSTDLAVIQLKYSHLILHISQQKSPEWRSSRITESIRVAGMKAYLERRVTSEIAQE